MIDLAVASAILLFGVLGLLSGAIKQLAHLAGLVVGWFLARPIAILLGPEVARRLGYPLLVTTVGLSFVVFFVLYVATVLLVRLVLARVFPEGERGVLNRAGGFALGSLKAAAIAFLLLSGLVLVESILTRLWSGWAREARGSYCLRFAREHSLFASLPAVGGLEKLLKAARDPAAAGKLAADPDFQALARDPRVKAMVEDGRIRRALAEGDSAELLASVKVLEALNDPKLVERLTRLGSGGSRPGAAKSPPSSPGAPARPPKGGPPAGPGEEARIPPVPRS